MSSRHQDVRTHICPCVQVPPLRVRPADIGALQKYFLTSVGRRMAPGVSTPPPASAQAPAAQSTSTPAAAAVVSAPPADARGVPATATRAQLQLTAEATRHLEGYAWPGNITVRATSVAMPLCWGSSAASPVFTTCGHAHVYVCTRISAHVYTCSCLHSMG